MTLRKRVLAALPPRLKRQIKDQLQDWQRRHPAPHDGFPRFGLEAAQIYPSGINFDECLRAGIAPQLRPLVIRKDTPVASIGSCFADEFASYMRRHGYNYVSAESDVFPASANWARVYTIPALRQIVLYSTDGEMPLAVERGDEGWFDPLRDPVAGHHPTRAAAEEAIRGHRAASRQAFADARVLIITLGQNEAWIDRESSLVWAHRPPSSLLQAQPDRFTVRVFSFEDDVRWLEDALRRLRAFNEGLDVLLTVSPVASAATFAGSEAVTQSFAGKCVLRAAADRMVQQVPRVWYFPAFELALAYNPHSLAADNRHVKAATIERIFTLLRQTVALDERQT